MTQPAKTKYTLLRERLQQELNEPGAITKDEINQVLKDFPPEDGSDPQPETWKDGDPWPTPSPLTLPFDEA
jgi:hypothetical protein